MKKFELTPETKVVWGKTLYRIKALISFGGVEKGDLGGFIEKESNLAQYCDAWVSGDAQVHGNAWVYEDARVSGDSSFISIYPIGSENGTLTAYNTKNGEIFCNRGCFGGSLKEFKKAVKANHGDNEHGQAYILAIKLIKLRIKARKKPQSQSINT